MNCFCCQRTKSPPPISSIGKREYLLYYIENLISAFRNLFIIFPILVNNFFHFFFIAIIFVFREYSPVLILRRILTATKDGAACRRRAEAALCRAVKASPPARSATLSVAGGPSRKYLRKNKCVMFKRNDLNNMLMKPELIVALDRPSSREAGLIFSRLPDQIQWYKIGLELFTAEGPPVLQLLKEKQKKIFLDLKLHDIPNTVARAVRAAAGHGVSLLTVHALGGEAMLKAAAEAVKTIGEKAPQIIAVTVLTSHSQEDLAAIGVRGKISDQVLRLAELALKCGADGLVASVNEAQVLRKKFGENFILVVPGIRPSGAETGDQKRVATPAVAMNAGADFLVVGRPIIDASDPHAAANAILEEMAEAADRRIGR